MRTVRILRTTDGRSFIDMFMAHGSTVLGHAHPAVMSAVREALEAGVVIGYETGEGERVARRISVVRAVGGGCTVRRFRQ